MCESAVHELERAAHTFERRVDHRRRRRRHPAAWLDPRLPELALCCLRAAAGSAGPPLRAPQLQLGAAETEALRLERHDRPVSSCDRSESEQRGAGRRWCRDE